jgi:hypothetical protein
MPYVLIPLTAILCIFGIPLSAIWTAHRRQILEMQLRLRQEGDAGVRAAIEELRTEIRSLRDTTMQYDLSFDTALQRMERRVEGVENRLTSVEGSRTMEVRTGL